MSDRSPNPLAAMFMFSCAGILFDLDGTLIDSINAVDRAWARWATRHGLDPAEVVPKIHGRRAQDSIRMLAPSPEIDLEAEQAWLENIEASDTEGIVPIDSAMQFVSEIPLDRWCVVTSGASPVAKARMNAVGLQPHCAVYGEDVEHGKPAPDPYLLGAKRLGFDPGDCLVFEDTAAGVRSGKSAGMKVIGVRGADTSVDLSEADAVISDYRFLTVEPKKDGLFVKFDSFQ